VSARLSEGAAAGGAWCAEAGEEWSGAVASIRAYLEGQRRVLERCQAEAARLRAAAA
jgi:hypothetical protein